MSEPSRRAILARIGELGEASVTEIAAPMSITRPAVSQHLKVLREAGVVSERKHGRERRYRIEARGIAQLRRAVTAFLLGELDDLERAVQRREQHMEPIIVERLIDAPADEAFALVTEPERLRRWQVVTASIDLRVGGSYRYTVTPGNVAGGEVTELDPGKRLAITWGWEHSETVPVGSSQIVIDLIPQDDKTLVRFTHTGLPESDAGGHAEGWNHYGDRLVAAATGALVADPWSVQRDEFDLLTAAESSWVHCATLLARVGPQHRELQTPCADYDLHGLVEHLMGSLRGLTGAAGGEVPDEIEASSAEDYIGQAAEHCLRAWRGRGTDGEVPFGEGTAPAALAIGIVSLEFFVHAWDIAQTIDAPFDPAPALTEFVAGVAQSTIRPEFRGDGKGFAEEQPRTEDPLLALMAFTGRLPLHER